MSENNSSKLCNVPLSEEEPGDSVKNAVKAKANSLKRFFKLSTKKDDDSIDENIEAKGTSSETEVASSFKKEHFPLAVGDHESFDPDQAGCSTDKKDKKSLKASISNYWNHIVKRRPAFKFSPKTPTENLNNEFAKKNNKIVESGPEKPIKSNMVKNDEKSKVVIEGPQVDPVHTLMISNDSNDEEGK